RPRPLTRSRADSSLEPRVSNTCRPCRGGRTVGSPWVLTRERSGPVSAVGGPALGHRRGSAGGAPSGRQLAEQTLDEQLRVEGGEVVDALPESDQLHGQAELSLDGHHDAPLRGAVELGQ